MFGTGALIFGGIIIGSVILFFLALIRSWSVLKETKDNKEENNTIRIKARIANMLSCAMLAVSIMFTLVLVGLS